MRAEVINPFVQAATEILESELGAEVDRGVTRLQKTAYTTTDVTMLVGVSGRVEGLVLLSMDLSSARGIASARMGVEVEELDEPAQESLRELEAAVAQRAARLLEVAGFACTMAKPALIEGSGVMLTTLDLNRLVVPLKLGSNEVELQVILREIPHTRAA